MEQLSLIYPPNRPFDRVILPSETPVLYDNLFFLDINDQGEVILGSSNVTGTHWLGTLMYYKSIESAQENIYSNFFISHTTASEGKFLKNSNYILLAEHNNHLKLLNPTENIGENSSIKCEDDFENTASIESIAQWDTESKFVTCSENTVSVWNIQNNSVINLLHKYIDYHTNAVRSVDVNKSQPNTFISCGLDRRACIWDDRVELPASVLYINEFSALMSVAWNPLNTDTVVVASEAGDIYLIDVKQPKEFLSVHNCFEDSIYRMVFNNSGFLAVCGDTTEVKVFTCTNNTFNILYTNLDHKDLVRGAAWNREILYTCGFDKEIIKHVM